MKISIINGSPKVNGVSSLIIKQMEKLLDIPLKYYQATKLVHKETPSEDIEEILASDVLLIVAPLYVDSFPAPLIELLTRLENHVNPETSKPQVFAIINAAFDVSQTALSLEMVEHFANRSGFPWGYCVGIGKGSMIYSAGENWEKGPASAVNLALLDLAEAIKLKASKPNVFVEPNFSGFLYKLIANISFFIEAKRNKAGKVGARPYV